MQYIQSLKFHFYIKGKISGCNKIPHIRRISDTLTECNGTNSIRCELFTPTLNSCAFNSVSDLELRIPKECSNYRTIALISNTSKVMLKILQARLQQYMNRELPDVQAGFRKHRETKDQIANIFGSSKKRVPKKTTSTLLTTPKPLTVWITTNCGKFLKRWEYQTTSSAS